jgi:hypothetical protein
MVEEAPETDPDAELWGVEEDETSVSIDEFANLDEDDELA